ncbi:retrotransposon protein, putative, ty1-copia subclass [Tanacetum coccineum]
MVESSIVKGIASVAIIDRQLPFEYTIASRSTDMMVIVLRVDKKWSIIKQPIPLAPPADSKYLRSGMRFMMLIMRLLVLGSKTIGELHAMLIEYEKGLPKKAETPQVMMIKGGKIQKANKKSLKAKGKGKANGKGKDKHGYISKPKNPKPTAKEHPAKDDTCHHCKEVGHWKRNCPVFLAELLKKKKQVGTASSSETATRILNMVPTKKVDKTPYELWYGKVSNLSYLKVWGCKAFVKQDTPDKLQQRSVKYVEFLEKNLLSQEISGKAEELKEIQDKDTSPSENTSEIPIEWIDAMNAEMQSMKDNQVWCLVDLPPNARLVAKGYTQTYGVDYDETFSPVADIRTIRILIAIAAFYDYEI